MRRSAEDAAKTRLALLEAALMAFEAKGWRGATFEHVAERAGVTRGALHHHFRSKETLLTEALDWGWSEYGQQLLPEGNSTPDALELLRQLLADFITLLRTDDRFRALAYTTVLVAPQALDGNKEENDALDAWRERIAATLTAEQTRASAETTAGLVLVLLQGLTVTAVTRPQDLPPPKEVTATTTMLITGLLGRGDTNSL